MLTTEHSTAGVAAVSALARFGSSTVQAAVLSAGAVPPLVDVIRSTATAEPIAAAATAALAGTAAAEGVPGAAGVVCDLLVACLQPSSLVVAADAATALLAVAGRYALLHSLLNLHHCRPTRGISVHRSATLQCGFLHTPGCMMPAVTQ